MRRDRPSRRAARRARRTRRRGRRPGGRDRARVPAAGEVGLERAGELARPAPPARHRRGARQRARATPRAAGVPGSAGTARSARGRSAANSSRRAGQPRPAVVVGQAGQRGERLGQPSGQLADACSMSAPRRAPCPTGFHADRLASGWRLASPEVHGVLAFGDSITNGGGELQWGVALQSWALWMARGLGLPYTGYAATARPLATWCRADPARRRGRSARPGARYDLGCLYIGVNDVARRIGTRRRSSATRAALATWPSAASARWR